jgi:hypothetical protein
MNVHNRTVYWAKNKCMFRSLSHGLFLTYRVENVFPFASNMIYRCQKISHVWFFINLLCMSIPLTWTGGFLYAAANLCPYWPHAQSQLPHFSSPYPIPIAPFFPPSHTHMWILWTQMTVTCPSLLPSGTKKTFWKWKDRYVILNPKSEGA